MRGPMRRGSWGREEATQPCAEDPSPVSVRRPLQTHGQRAHFPLPTALGLRALSPSLPASHRLHLCCQATRLPTQAWAPADLLARGSNLGCALTSCPGPFGECVQVSLLIREVKTVVLTPWGLFAPTVTTKHLSPAPHPSLDSTCFDPDLLLSTLKTASCFIHNNP